MKKLRAGLLIMLLLALCTCKQAAPEPVSADNINRILTFLSGLHYSEEGAITEAETETETEPTTYAEIATSKNDPYSYVVNAYYAIAQNPGLLYDKESPPENLAQGFKLLPSIAEYANFHSFFALQYMMSYNRNLLYALYDINGDGRKELLFGAGSDYGTDLCDIYAIQNGVATQQLYHPGSTSTMSLFKNGTVRTSFGKSGYYCDSYYRFKDGQLCFCLSLSTHERWVSDEEELAFDYYKDYTDDLHNEIEISQEEYQRLRREYEGDGREVEISWRPVADYGM